MQIIQKENDIHNYNAQNVCCLKITGHQANMPLGIKLSVLPRPWGQFPLEALLAW